MRVDLGKFALRGVEAQLGNDVGAGIRLALCHHVLKLRWGGEQLAAPRFQPKDWATTTAPRVSYDVPLDPTTETLLKQEASSRGVTTSQLAVEAVLAFLATLDLAQSQL